MWVLETVAVAFGMYSALPTPRAEWNETNMRYALAAFPLVGAVLGLAWWGVCALSAALALPDLLRGALLCALPALVTGGIHLDGYADSSDALASHASPARKQEILRDPHCGAFAVIRLCVYFIACFSLCCEAEPTPRVLWCVGAGFALSRALSGLLLTVLPIAGASSLAKAFADAAAKRRVRVLLGGIAALSAAAMLWLGGLTGAAMLCAAAIAVRRYVHTATREFGGTSGDLAGWFLVKAEFWMLAAVVAVQYVEKLL
ncbi:MAG: adenosylcobinamide-GDP ribazoletransferase [Oscillospiraceae bacterium]|nr:adenosylcobinamide-GDP ribazoletransferase [Oscillospiraceae bacterium]